MSVFKIRGMNGRNLYDKVFAIFGALMVFFYFGLGYYVIFSPYLDHIDTPLRVIIGAPLLVYAVYRLFVSYSKIKENFFGGQDDDR